MNPHTVGFSGAQPFMEGGFLVFAVGWMLAVTFKWHLAGRWSERLRMGHVVW